MRFLFILLLLPLPAQAGSAWAQNMLARLDYLYVHDTHRTSYVWDGRFRAIDGTPYDKHELYISSRPQFNTKLGIKLYDTGTLRLSLPLHYDNGYRAALYDAEPFLGGGLIGRWHYRENLTLGFALHDVVQVGGRLQESPCYDGFRRAFHCGTGLPWTDAKPYLQRDNTPAFFKLSLDWRF